MQTFWRVIRRPAFACVGCIFTFTSVCSEAVIINCNQAKVTFHLGDAYNKLPAVQIARMIKLGKKAKKAGKTRNIKSLLKYAFEMRQDIEKILGRVICLHACADEAFQAMEQKGYSYTPQEKAASKNRLFGSAKPFNNMQSIYSHSDNGSFNASDFLNNSIFEEFDSGNDNRYPGHQCPILLDVGLTMVIISAFLWFVPGAQGIAMTLGGIGGGMMSGAYVQVAEERQGSKWW